MNTYEITGYFGYWGMQQTIHLKGNSYAEATTDLKSKVQELFKGRGKGRNQKKFYCKVIGYRVVKEVKPFIEFKTPKNYK